WNRPVTSASPEGGWLRGRQRRRAVLLLLRVGDSGGRCHEPPARTRRSTTNPCPLLSLQYGSSVWTHLSALLHAGRPSCRREERYGCCQSCCTHCGWCWAVVHRTPAEVRRVPRPIGACERARITRDQRDRRRASH